MSPYEYHNDQLGVRVGVLIEGRNADDDSLCLISGRALRNRIENGYIKRLRQPGPNTPALVKWDNLPREWQKMLNETFGEPQKQVRQSIFERHYHRDSQAIDFYTNYQLADGKMLPDDVIDEYILNASVLNTVDTIYAKRYELRKSLRGEVRDVWTTVTNECNRFRDIQQHTLPANAASLRRKLKDYKKQGYESLIHGNFCNKTAQKITDVKQESVLIRLFDDPRNLDNEQIRTMYNMVAEKMDWKTVTVGTIKNYRAQYDLLTTAGRRGVTSFMDTKAMQVRRSKPTAPLYFWSMDGWDVELLYQQNVIDAKGNKLTTYHNRLTVVVILDPSVNYPIGYATGTHESPELIKAALRNAIKHTEELFGSKYRTHQLQSDHYSLKALTPYYEAIADKVTPARVKNAKAKPVEPYFKQINKKYCQLMPNWSGFGVTADKDNQPNVEYLNKYRHQFPDKIGCADQVSRIVTLERADKRKKYLALWEKTPDENKLALSLENYLYWFGAETGETNSLTGNGLIMTIEGEKHYYDCFDPEFRRHSREKWTVRFDPELPRQAMAVSADGKLRFMLEEKYVQPMALRDRKPGDSDELQKVRDFNKNLISEIIEAKTEAYQQVDDLFADNPKLNDTLAKLVLVDSRGQHKNERNAGRAITEGQKVSKKQDAKTEKQAAKAWESEQEEYIDSKIMLNKYL